MSKKVIADLEEEEEEELRRRRFRKQVFGANQVWRRWSLLLKTPYIFSLDWFAPSCMWPLCYGWQISFTTCPPPPPLRHQPQQRNGNRNKFLNFVRFDRVSFLWELSSEPAIGLFYSFSFSSDQFLFVPRSTAEWNSFGKSFFWALYKVLFHDRDAHV